MNRLLALAAAIEAGTGVGLMLDPPLVTQLLLGAEVSGAAIAVARVAGAGLLSLGLACWPGIDAGDAARPRRALLTFNVLVTFYLLFLGIRGEWIGRLFWPAAALHAVLSVLLARAWFEARKAAGRR